MRERLPLSWIETEGIRPEYRAVYLPLSRLHWVTFGDIPEGYSPLMIREDLQATWPGGFVVRGCTDTLAACFEAIPSATVTTGAEAVLDLQREKHLQRKSVLTAVARASKEGCVKEYSLHDKGLELLERFHGETRHASKPQLDHLFRTTPSRSCRCFAFVTKTGTWLAAITLSQRGAAALHTELMLKRTGAQADVMTGLISGIFNILAYEGMREWSLGEVPFRLLREQPPNELNSLERMMASIASLWQHAYDFEGLYRFKNKFRPDWRPVSLCSNRSITPLLLAELAVSMQFTGLLLHESAAKAQQWLLHAGQEAML